LASINLPSRNEHGNVTRQDERKKNVERKKEKNKIVKKKKKARQIRTGITKEPFRKEVTHM